MRSNEDVHLWPKGFTIECSNVKVDILYAMFFSHMFGGSQSYLIGLKLKFLGMFSMQYAKNNFMLCEFQLKVC